MFRCFQIFCVENLQSVKNASKAVHVSVLQAFVGLPGAGAGAIFCGHTQPLQALPAMSEVGVSSLESRFASRSYKNNHNLSAVQYTTIYGCHDIQTSRMRCLLPAFYRRREAEFRPRSTRRCKLVSSCFPQVIRSEAEEKILVSDHTPIMGWLLQKLITGFGLGSETYVDDSSRFSSWQ